MSRDRKLPSDRLKRPQSPWRIAIIIAASLGLVAGGSFAANAAFAPDESSTTTVGILDGAEGKPTAPQIFHKLLVPHQEKSLVPPPPPPPPPVPEVQVSPGSGGGGGGGPVRCPVGSTANSNDGVNDTSCFPNVCFSITVPDPAHPECNSAFRP